LVKCPLCGKEFEAPNEPPPPPRVLRAPMRPVAAPPPSPRTPFDYHDATADGEPDPRARAAVRSAVSWLRMSILLQGISGLLCCCGPGMDHNGDSLFVSVPLVLVVKYVPLLFALVASVRLPERKSPGLCRAGAVLMYWTSLLGLLEAFIGLVIWAVETRMRHSTGTAVSLFFAFLGVPGTVCGFVAGTKVLTVLSRAAASRPFR
jgi:hypothetical protein